MVLLLQVCRSHNIVCCCIDFKYCNFTFSPVSSNSLLLVLVGFPLYRILSENSNLTSSFLICIYLLYFTCLMVSAELSRAILDTSGQSGNTFLILDFSGNASEISQFNMMLAVLLIKDFFFWS